MKAWLRLLKARLLLLCSAGVVIVGLALVAYFLGLVAWQLDTRLATGSWVALPAALVFADRALLHGGDLAPVLAFIPHFKSLFTQLNWAWNPHEVVAQTLNHLHIGVLPGLIGAAIMAAGISGVLRHFALIRIHKRRRKEPVQPALSQRAELSLPDADSAGRREPVIGAIDLAPAPANDAPAPQPALQTTAIVPARFVARPCRTARRRPIRRRAAA